VVAVDVEGGYAAVTLLYVFGAGVAVGAFVGVFSMCLLIASRDR